MKFLRFPPPPAAAMSPCRYWHGLFPAVRSAPGGLMVSAIPMGVARKRGFSPEDEQHLVDMARDMLQQAAVSDGMLICDESRPYDFTVFYRRETVEVRVLFLPHHADANGRALPVH